MDNLQHEFTSSRNEKQEKQEKDILLIGCDTINKNTYYPNGKASDYALYNTFTRYGKKIEY